MTTAEDDEEADLARPYSDAPRPKTAWSGNMPAARISSAANIHMTRLRRGRAQVSSGL